MKSGSSGFSPIQDAAQNTAASSAPPQVPLAGAGGG